MSLQDYYARRACEYEAIYHRPHPVRQHELAEITSDMRKALAKRRVPEIACGTGFWASVAAQVGESVLAVDISEEMLAIARRKELPRGKERFVAQDAYSLDSLDGAFDAALVNFWLSHVPKSRLQEFTAGLHQKLDPRAVVFMADNVYVPEVGGELVTRTECEDSFKLRELSDGSRHEVIKNYYSEGQLRGLFEPVSSQLETGMGKFFWWASYVTA
jgi:SAM-dependent methyltransferase